MNPVFQREMRAQSRGPKPWRLRMFVAGAAILGLATLGLKQPEMFVGSGKGAFLAMNFGAIALLGIISPMLTHDLLSRERREGDAGPALLHAADLEGDGRRQGDGPPARRRWGRGWRWGRC
jgi:hypothetical protein